MKTKETVSKMANMLIVSIMLILVLLGVIVYLLEYEPLQEEEEVLFCGVTDTDRFNLDDKVSYRRAANFLDADFNPENGKKIAFANCSACHKFNNRLLVGPSLSNLSARIPQRQGWLIEYITNSDSLFISKDTHAIALRRRFKVMDWKHEFDNLNPRELNDLAGFILMN
jgi:mono/diheme cytochrome c family protein